MIAQIYILPIYVEIFCPVMRMVNVDSKGGGSYKQMVAMLPRLASFTESACNEPPTLKSGNFQGLKEVQKFDQQLPKSRTLFEDG